MKKFKMFSISLNTFLFLLAFASFAKANSIENDEPVRGVVKAVHEAWISTDLNARVVKIFRREGESFKKGDSLVSFDCLEFNEKLNSLRADTEFESASLENAKNLDKRNAIAKFEVEQARFRFEKAKAEFASLGARLRDCNIVAPFDGRIAEVKIHVFETASPGQPFLRIVGTETIEVELIIPSRFLQWIKPGIQFDVLIDETGKKHEVILQRVGAVVDSSSQTVRIVGLFKRLDPEILPGMSLMADFKSLVE